MQAIPDAAQDPAGRLFDEACRRLRSGELGADELQGLAARMETLAGGLGDDAHRVEMRAAARLLRHLPEALAEALAEDAVYAPLESSDLIARLEGIVDWAWESLPTAEACAERARAALDRIDRLPAGSPEESRVVGVQRADLADRLAALEARRS